MKKTLNTYLVSLLGPVSLFNKRKYEELFISLTLLIVVCGIFLFTNDTEVFKASLLSYLLFSISLTYFSLAENSSISKNIFNCFMAILTTCLFSFGIYAVIEFTSVSRKISLDFLLMALILINFFVLISKKNVE